MTKVDKNIVNRSAGYMRKNLLITYTNKSLYFKSEFTTSKPDRKKNVFTAIAAEGKPVSFSKMSFPSPLKLLNIKELEWPYIKQHKLIL